MNKKLYVWLVGVLALGLLFYSLFLAWQESQKQPAKPTDKITLPTTKGLPIEVNNFLAKPKEKFTYGSVLAETSQYKIIYFSEDEGVLIILKQAPLAQAQAEAENELLKQLGVPQQQACQLKIYVSVPMDVNEALAGQNYQMSFCPGGKHF